MGNKYMQIKGNARNMHGQDVAMGNRHVDRMASAELHAALEVRHVRD